MSAAVAVQRWMIVVGGQTPSPLPLALTTPAMQSLTSGSNHCRSLPRRHLERSPPFVIVVVIVAAIVNVIAIVVIVDVPRPSTFRRPKLIVDCVHCNTVTLLLPSLAFVIILAPLLLLPPVIGWWCGCSPLVGRRRGCSPPLGDFAVAPPSLRSVLGWGKRQLELARQRWIQK